MPKEHDAVETPVSVQQIATAFYDAYFRYLNSCPKPESVKILLSHWALETGWGRSMKCFNVGNVKSYEGDGYDYCYFACNEILPSAAAHSFQNRSPYNAKITEYRADGKCTIWFYPKHRCSRFRAFGSLYEGAYDHLKLLIQKFGMAWPFVIEGDPAAFSKALKAQRYYTADESAYTKTLSAVFRTFDDIELPEGPMFTEQERRELLSELAVSLMELCIQQK